MRLGTVMGVVLAGLAMAACERQVIITPVDPGVAELIAGGGPPVQLASEPRQVFHRRDGAYCQVLDFWQEQGRHGHARQGEATVCLENNGRWTLQEKKWYEPPSGGGSTVPPYPPSEPPYYTEPEPPTGGSDWLPVTR